MRSSSHRFANVALTIVAAALFTGCAGQKLDPPASPIAQQIAEAHGVYDFPSIERIAFTFNVERKGKGHTWRWFSWEPKTDTVTFRDQKMKESITYVRSELTGDSAKELIAADKKFVNDSFWFLLPVHLSWSDDLVITEHGTADLPIGEGQARKVTVHYGDKQGGYTPGDVYDLYLDSNNRILQWAFYRSGGEKPNLVCTWEDYRQIGPLILAIDHYNADKSFRLWISDIDVATR